MGETGPGFVYFIQAGNAGPIKIGWALNDVVGRLAVLQIGSWEELRLLGVIPGSQEDERRLHASFAHARIRGEWFRASKVLRYITNCATDLVTGRAIPRPPSARYYIDGIIEDSSPGARSRGTCSFCLARLGSGKEVYLISQADTDAGHYACRACVTKYRIGEAPLSHPQPDPKPKRRPGRPKKAQPRKRAPAYVSPPCSFRAALDALRG